MGVEVEVEVVPVCCADRPDRDWREKGEGRECIKQGQKRQAYFYFDGTVRQLQVIHPALPRPARRRWRMGWGCLTLRCVRS